MQIFEAINNYSQKNFEEKMMMVCGAKNWVKRMLELRPFFSNEQVFLQAQNIWFSLTKEDWLESFSHHPKIGGKDALRKKFNTTKDWSSKEQAGMQGATDDVIDGLASGNDAYDEKFGFVFLICASGKSAQEILISLNDRLGNTLEQEIENASIELNEIIKIRLTKLV